jgi:FkbM family methyltransferase
MAVGDENILSTSAIASKAATSVDLAMLAESPRVKADGGLMPPMVSYAQNFEDVMLRRALQDIEAGFYVDVGAGDPDADSVTRWFYENGWRGINVEPDPRYFARLEERRPEDTNVQCAVGAANGNIIFNVSPVVGLSTGSERRLAEIANIEHLVTKPMVVPAVTLDQLFTLSCGKAIEFLKIDAEGMEDEILKSMSFMSYRPRIIVAEATMANNQQSSHQIWEPRLLNNGYQLAWFDGLNRFYVRQEDEWRSLLFVVPPCYFDNFFQVTIDAHVKEVAERVAITEHDLAVSRAETEEARREAVKTVERYEAALSEATAKATAAGARAEAIEAEAHRTAAEFELRKAVLESDLERSRVEAAGALRGQQNAEAEADRAAAEFELRKAVVESDLERSRVEAAGALRGQQNAEAEAHRAAAEFEVRKAVLESDLERSRVAEAEAAERVAVLEVTLVRAKREAAEALRREQTAEAELAEALHRQQTSEPQRAMEAAALKKGGTISRLNLVARWHIARLLSVARRAARQRDWPNAEIAYSSIIAVCGTIPRIWLQYGHALKEQGNLTGAERAYREALTLDPSDPEAHLQLGHALKLGGASAPATEAYVEAFRLRPSFDAARRELVAMEFSARQLAEIVLTADLKPPPAGHQPLPKGVSGARGRLLLEIARAASRRGDWPAAAEKYERLLTKFSGAAAVWTQLGHAFKEQGLLQEAQGAYFEALKRNRNNADTFLHLGHALKLQAEHEASLKAYLWAFRLQPNLVAVHEELEAHGIGAQQRLELLKQTV